MILYSVRLILPAVLLMGCASTPPLADKNAAPQDRAVNYGQPAPEDRSSITSSTQQIFNAEHAGGGGVPSNTPTPNQGIP